MNHRSAPDVAVLPVERRAVEMSVLAEPMALSVVRVVAADLATRADFDLDSVSDLEIAVEEACAALLEVALPGSMLTCSIALGPRGISVDVEAHTGTQEVLRTESFGWRVLNTLADGVAVSRRTAPGGTHATTAISLRKNLTGEDWVPADS